MIGETLDNKTRDWNYKPDTCIKCDARTNWHVCPKCFFEIRETNNRLYQTQWMAILEYREGNLPDPQHKWED